MISCFFLLFKKKDFKCILNLTFSAFNWLIFNRLLLGSASVISITVTRPWFTLRVGFTITPFIHLIFFILLDILLILFSFRQLTWSFLFGSTSRSSRTSSARLFSSLEIILFSTFVFVCVTPSGLFCTLAFLVSIS